MDTNELKNITHPMDKDMRDMLKTDGDVIARLKTADLSLNEITISGQAFANLHCDSEDRFAAVSSMCLDPILACGEKALEDNQAGRISRDLEQVVSAIIVSTGIASILLTKDQIIDYNTGLGHDVFYALTSFPHNSHKSGSLRKVYDFQTMQ